MSEVRVCCTELLRQSLLRVAVDPDHVVRIQLVRWLLGNGQCVEVLMSTRFNAEDWVVPSVDLVANRGPKSCSLEGWRPIPVDKGEPAWNVSVCVWGYLHERVLSPAQRWQRIVLRDFQWALQFEGAFLDWSWLLVCSELLLADCHRSVSTAVQAVCMLWIRQNIKWASLFQWFFACAPVVFFPHLCILLLHHSCVMHLQMPSHFFELFQSKIEFLHICRCPDLLVACWTCSRLPEFFLLRSKVEQRVCVELLLFPLLLALPGWSLVPPLLLLVLVFTLGFFRELLVLDYICDGWLVVQIVFVSCLQVVQARFRSRSFFIYYLFLESVQKSPFFLLYFYFLLRVGCDAHFRIECCATGFLLWWLSLSSAVILFSDLVEGGIVLWRALSWLLGQ